MVATRLYASSMVRTPFVDLSNILKQESVGEFIKQTREDSSLHQKKDKTDMGDKVEDARAQRLKADKGGEQAVAGGTLGEAPYQVSTTSIPPAESSGTHQGPTATPDDALKADVASQGACSNDRGLSTQACTKDPESQAGERSVTDEMGRAKNINAKTEAFPRPMNSESHGMLQERRQQYSTSPMDEPPDAVLGLATLKQAFATQYTTLATKCQGWERYAAKIKVQLEVLDIDHSVLRETCSQQTETIGRQQARLESQCKYIERLEMENAEVKEALRERDNRSRDVESRLSSLEERIASRAPSSIASTAASQRQTSTTAMTFAPARLVDQHVNSLMQHIYQPPSPPVSVLEHSQSCSNTIAPQDGRAAFHSSNIRYSSEEERLYSDKVDLRAPSPLDFSALESTIGCATSRFLGQPTDTRHTAFPAHQHALQVGTAVAVSRNEQRPSSRLGGRESRRGYRESEGPASDQLGHELPLARFVDGNGSIRLAGAGVATTLALASQSVEQVSCSQGDDLPVRRPSSRFGYTREAAPSPPSMLVSTGHRLRGIPLDNNSSNNDKIGSINCNLPASLIDHRTNGVSATHVAPLHFARSTSALGLAAPQKSWVRSGSAASGNTVTGNGQGYDGGWVHLRSSTDPTAATQEALSQLTSAQDRPPLRRSSLNHQQQLAHVQSRRNSGVGSRYVATSRLSKYSSEGTDQLPAKRGGSRVPSSRNGSTGVVHDAIPMVKDDIFSDGRASSQTVAQAAHKVSTGIVAKGRTLSTRPSAATEYGEEGPHRLVSNPSAVSGDGRKSSMGKHPSSERYVAHSPKVLNVAAHPPLSYFSPQSSFEEGDHPSCTSSYLKQSDSHSASESMVENPSFISVSATHAVVGAGADVAAEARRGAHRRLYLSLREELSAEDLQKFERYVHRYDALEIPVDGPRGLVNRVKKLLLLSDPTLRERSEDWKRRKEMAREFEKIVTSDL